MIQDDNHNDRVLLRHLQQKLQALELQGEKESQQYEELSDEWQNLALDFVLGEIFSESDNT